MHPFVEFIGTPPGTHILTDGNICIRKEIKDGTIYYEVIEKDLNAILSEEQFAEFLKTINPEGYNCLPTSKRIDNNNEASAMAKVF